LIEILFAIAIFTIGVVTIGYLIIDARVSLHYATDLTRARLLAAEGIEAVNSIRMGGFDLLPSGDYGLEINQGVWTLTSSSDERGKFTRTISIEDIDSDVKEVTSQISWEMFPGREKQVTYKTRFSNWMQVGGEAGELEIDLSQVTIDDSKTTIGGLFIRNNHNQEVVITDITVIWGTSALLERVAAGEVDLFTASTSAPVASGEAIDIIDYQIGAFSDFQLVGPIDFDGDISDTNFVVLLTFRDGSIRSVSISV